MIIRAQNDVLFFYMRDTLMALGNTIMEKEPNLENRTYEFIGRLALVLFSQNIKMSYSTLIKVLEDNNLDSYGSERGMASGIAAAYRRWEDIEKDCRIPDNTVIGEYFYKNDDSCCKSQEIVYAKDCFDTYREEDNMREFFEWCVPFKNRAISVFWEE